jgi:hypothetical protein
MEDLVFLNSIPVSLPRERIYKRLGARPQVTKINVQQRKRVEADIEEAAALIDLKGVARKAGIKEKSSSEIVLCGGITLPSKHLAALLGDCQQVLFMGAGAGKKIVESIKQNTRTADLSRGVVFDAVASEVVDSALDWMMSYFNQELRRQNRCLTRRRFSAGYGDFLLKNQKVIYNILELEKLGISLTEEYMLVPEKSVTALAGILAYSG